MKQLDQPQQKSKLSQLDMFDEKTGAHQHPKTSKDNVLIFKKKIKDSNLGQSIERLISHSRSLGW